MLPIPKRLLKFKCLGCGSMYIEQINRQHMLSYPACPNCQQPGQILGSVNKLDYLLHPVAVIKIYLP